MFKQTKNLFFILLMFVCYCDENSQITILAPPDPVYFTKIRQANIEFSDRTNVFKNQKNELVAIVNSADGYFQSSSSDTGVSWSAVRKIAEFSGQTAPVIVNNRFVGVQQLIQVKNGGQIYFYRRKKNGWSWAGEIRDSNWGTFSLAVFAKNKSGMMFCNWIDNRNGNPDVYFSSSADSGRTWSTNIKINDDQSGQEQNYRFLLAAEDGTLYAFWDDNRSPKTLYDIFCSVSTDAGQSWSRNLKINDDTLHVWQRNPYAICDKDGNIYVVWSDYRDKGAHGDIIANIYFSRSADGGKSWSKNIKISDARADHCMYPTLTLSGKSTLHCLYGSYDSKHCSDIFYSYSTNGGLSWSMPAKVNDNSERKPLAYQNAGVFVFKEDVVVGWYSRKAGDSSLFLSRRISRPDSNRIQETALTERVAEDFKIKKLNYRKQRCVFDDDFKNEISDRWQKISGIWIWKGHSYIGYDAGISMLKISPLKNFEFNGSFKLDPLNHQAAYVFVRCQKREDNRWSYYRILNFFRVGVNIDYFNGKEGLQIMQKSYPFRENSWYKFRAVMKGNRLNYFINDSLILSLDNLSQNPEGLIGIGSGATPTYFKDISAFEIE